MAFKEVIIHESVLREWASRDVPPLPPILIQKALSAIQKIKSTTPAHNLIEVEESPSTGFKTLLEQVEKGDIVKLSGVRAAHCLRIAREVLEGKGVTVILDTTASLP